jgi:hypothetical protein
VTELDDKLEDRFDEVSNQASSRPRPILSNGKNYSVHDYVKRSGMGSNAGGLNIKLGSKNFSAMNAEDSKGPTHLNQNLRPKPKASNSIPKAMLEQNCDNEIDGLLEP